MIETSSRLPEFVEAIVAAVAPAIPDGLVLYGDPGDQALPDLVVSVMWAPEDGDGATVRTERAEGLGHRYRDVYQVRCVVSIWSGDHYDTVASGMLRRCRDVMDSVELALKQTQGLGVLDDAGLGSDIASGVRQVKDGTAVEVRFSVVGTALR
jgi:hypothetical protein